MRINRWVLETHRFIQSCLPYLENGVVNSNFLMGNPRAPCKAAQLHLMEHPFRRDKNSRGYPEASPQNLRYPRAQPNPRPGPVRGEKHWSLSLFPSLSSPSIPCSRGSQPSYHGGCVGRSERCREFAPASCHSLHPCFQKCLLYQHTEEQGK